MSNDLMPQILTDTNFYLAWKRVRANRGAPGTDAVSLELFEADLDANLSRLKRQWKEEAYYPLPFRRVTVSKSDGSQRALAIPTVADRISQRAFVNVLEPLFEQVFHDCSFGYRPGRRVEQAVDCVLRHRENGHAWILDADITECFDSIDHDLLLRQLRRHIGDRDVLRAVRMWLDAGLMTADTPPSLRKSLLETAGQYARSLLREATIDDYDFDDLSLDAPLPVSDDSGACSADRRARLRWMGRISKEAACMAYATRRKWLPLVAGKSVWLTGGVAAVAAATALQAGMRRHAAGRTPRLGTPQGSPLSPLLANIYLHDLDTALLQHNLRLVRYADDFVICCGSEARAEHALVLVREELTRLHLKLHPQKTRIARCGSEFLFLGYTFDAEGAFRLDPKPERPFVQAPRRPTAEWTEQGVRQVGSAYRQGMGTLSRAFRWKRPAASMPPPDKKER